MNNDAKDMLVSDEDIAKCRASLDPFLVEKFGEAFAAVGSEKMAQGLELANLLFAAKVAKGEIGIFTKLRSDLRDAVGAGTWFRDELVANENGAGSSNVERVRMLNAWESILNRLNGSDKPTERAPMLSDKEMGRIAGNDFEPSILYAASLS